MGSSPSPLDLSARANNDKGMTAPSADLLNDLDERGLVHDSTDRRALADLARLQPHLVRERREEVRRVDRPAAREDVDDVEVREGEDRGEDVGR